MTLSHTLEELAGRATSAPWPSEVTGDGKAILIGCGMVDGYDVAELDRDDTPRKEVEANAALIVALRNNVDTIIAALRAMEERS